MPWGRVVLGDPETPSTDPGIMLPQIVIQFLQLIDSFF